MPTSQRDNRPFDAVADRLPTGPARILVVDDEIYLVEMLATTLRFVGYDVETATTGMEALAKSARMRPHMLVLDVMLPDIDGFELCRQIRAAGNNVGVVFLTARDSNDDSLTGFDAGGDDYIAKPFSLDDVLARVRAVLRRVTSGSGVGTKDQSVLRFADLELDTDRHEVRRQGQLIDLSPTEFAVLRYLMTNSNRVLSKAQILEHVWQYDFRGDTALVETYISLLRKKVDRYEPKLIHTRRGVGYMLRIDT